MVNPEDDIRFSIFGQNVKLDYLRACSQVCVGAGQEHWLSVDIVDMTIGMFLTAIKAISVNEHNISVCTVTIQSGDKILLFPCNMSNTIADSSRTKPYNGKGLRI